MGINISDNQEKIYFQEGMAGSRLASAPVTRHMPYKPCKREGALRPAVCAGDVGFHARCCSCKADHATSSPPWPSHRRPIALTPLEAHATAAVRDGVRLAQCESIAQLRAAILGRLRILRPRNGERAALWVDKHRVLQAHGWVDPIAKTAITRRCAVWGCFWGP